jgi:Spy/CpxP family protein refolding chaperone
MLSNITIKGEIMRTRLGVGLVAIFFAASVPLAYANHSHKDEKKWKEHKEEMFKDLDLTAEQKKQLEAHKKQKHEDMNKMMQEIEAKEKALNAELAKENLDMTKINQIQADLKSLESQKVDQRVKHMIEMRQTLKPEQYKKLSDKHHSHGMHDHKEMATENK